MFQVISKSISNLVNLLMDDPKVGGLLSVFHVLLAAIFGEIQHYTIPEVVMQLFQLAAWIVAIFIGLVSIFGYFKKWILALILFLKRRKFIK